MEPEQDKTSFAELRRRALAFLARPRDNSEASDFSAEDVERLIEAFDRHQLELERQNAALRRAQEELGTSQNRYTELYDFAPIAYFTLDDQAGIVEVNLTAAEMLGMPRAELPGRPFTDFIAPEDQEVFYQQRKKLLLSRQRSSYDLRLRKNDGATFHASVVAVVSPDRMAPPGQCRLMISDISRRKEEEFQRLSRLKDRYRAIVMDQNELICRFDPEGKITFVNDAYCRFFGVKPKDILGTNFLPNVHEEDLPLVQEHFRSLTRREPVKVIEHRVYRPDGGIAWQQWSGRALFDGAGDLIECQAVGRDITALKETETRLQNELKLRQLFLDALPCMALLVRYPSREIVAVNLEAAAAGARPGTPCYETFCRLPGPCPWCLADPMWQTREPQNSRFWAFDLYWDTYWIPVDGDLYLQYSFDITEHEKTKNALEKAKEECERIVEERTQELRRSHDQLLHSEKLAAVGNLSASIAHEFNNPLQSIMTIIKGISQYANLDQKEGELLNLAFQECRRMANLIANLQDFYKPTTGKIEQVDLNAVFDALLLMTKKDYKTRKIAVEREYAADLPTIAGVADQLKQVLLNLLNNAADACEGGGTITVVTERIDRGRVAVRVKDTGVGIAPENIRHIFQPFFTTKSAKKGTGLGLPVSYGIVKKHGGDIEVRSERGKGSTFSVFFPIKVKND